MKYDLVFEGGGAKGFVLVGACEEFFAQGHSFGRLLGTSAGAITATMLAVGYTPGEMLEAMAEQAGGKSVFASFMALPAAFTDDELSTGATAALLADIRFNFLPERVENRVDAAFLKALAAGQRSRHLLAFVERGGWYGADPFVVWLRQRLDSGPWKNGQRHFSKFTLAQLFAETGVELSLVASDTSDQRMLVLNHRTAPDCPIVWAVRMSMSIPLVWNEVEWQREWGSYRNRDITGHLIVDGGLLSNFPLELFVSADAHVTSLMGPKGENGILGMLIDEQLPVTTSKGIFVTVRVRPGELRTVQRLLRLADTATTAHDKMVMEENEHLVARLPAKGYGTTEFDMSEERRNALVAAGRAAIKEYFETPGGLALPTKGARGAADHEMSRTDRIATSILE